MFHMQNITGHRIRLARHNKNLTQTQLATQLQMAGYDYSRNTIAKIEIGIRQVTDKELKIFADILSVSVGWFFSEETGICGEGH